MLELDDKVGIVAVFPHKPGRKRFLASKAGYGFVMPEEEAVATRKAGKQVLNVDGGSAALCLEATGDQVAVIGDNGKILIFPLQELPEMPRGKGVKLQSYREGGLKDAMLFAAADGAAWTDGAGRVRTWPEWRDWSGKRASAGRVAPKGFPTSKRFKPRSRGRAAKRAAGAARRTPLPMGRHPSGKPHDHRTRRHRHRRGPRDQR